VDRWLAVRLVDEHRQIMMRKWHVFHWWGRFGFLVSRRWSVTVALTLALLHLLSFGGNWWRGEINHWGFLGGVNDGPGVLDGSLSLHFDSFAFRRAVSSLFGSVTLLHHYR